jgi:AraC-like DNA-binding protein
VLKGHQQIRSEQGLTLDIEAGQIGFIPKGIYTITDLLADGDEFESWHIFLDVAYFEKLRSLALGQLSDEIVRPVIEAPAMISAFLETLSQVAVSLPDAGALYYEGKVKEFFGILLAAKGPQCLSCLFNLYEKKPSVNLGSFMEAHFDKPFSVEDYAFLTGLSKSSFNRVFKLKFGSSPRKWLIEKRLHKAGELLGKRRHSVAEVATLVGFNHTSHFIKSFKKQYGHTPGEHLPSDNSFD